MLLYHKHKQPTPELPALRKRGPSPCAENASSLEKLEYLGREYGIRFFPAHGIDLVSRHCSCSLSEKCSSPGKHPLHKGWNKEKQNPKSILYSANNIGMATGQITKSGKYLVIIDFDEEGLELKTKLPKTVVTKTGRENGEHYWFLTKQKIPSSVGILGKKIDVRGLGGFVVAPGSMHSSGKTYVFKKECGLKIADLPEWLEEKLLFASKQNISNKSKKETILKNVMSLETAKQYLDKGKIPTGVRNTVIYRLTLAQRANGLTKTKLLTYAKNLREKYCENPTTVHDSEINAIVYNIMKHCKTPFFVNTNVEWFYERITSKKIVEIDKKFFETAFEKDDSGSISFKQIMELREFWHKHHKTHSFVMKGSLVGVLLKSLGFQKKHTEKGNVWKIKLAKDFKLLYDEHCKQNSMKTEDKTVVKEFEVEIVVHPNEKKYQSDGTVEKQQLIIENIDKEIETEPELTSKMLEFLKNDIQVDDIIGFDENIWRVAEHDKNKVPFIKNLIEVKRQHGKYVEKQSAKNLVPTIFNLFEQYKIGYLEILYRNNKVFGIETKKKVKISY